MPHGFPSSRRFAALQIVAASTLLLIIVSQISWPDCGGLGPMPVPNVLWSLGDSVAACPAGDSLTTLGPGHPSRLRIKIYYSDADCNARIGVPPESIWVTLAKTGPGTVTVNDQTLNAKTFADDSTNSLGITWVTIPSLSGCGTLRATLYVSGVAQGYKDARVRTTDSNANGRVTSVDADSACDLNYNGSVDASDRAEILNHVTDWRRNALHGTLVKRTSPPNTPATGDLSWSPSGRRLVFSVPGGGGHCILKHIATDPAGGNNLQQFTWLPNADDYDPSWSPLGDEIFFFRTDLTIYRKGIPGIATDTSEVVVYAGAGLRCCGAISPDGRTIAFSQFDTGTQRWTLWTVPATGGAARQVTTAGNYRDWYPKWSPDGQTLIFERRTLTSPISRSLYTVPAFADPPPVPTLFHAPAGGYADFPSYAEDGGVVVSGIGPTESAPTSNTLDATGTSGFRAIANYPGYTFSGLSPRMSPDGTRLAMFARPPSDPGGSAQLWAARRNMSLPPYFTAVGGQSVADSTTRVYFTMLQGQAYQVTVAASDPEADLLTYRAYYLQLGMAFDSTTRTFSWTPPQGTAGQVFHVKFAVATSSGGVDAIIAVINVVQSLGPGASRASQAKPAVSPVSDGDGLVRFVIEGEVPKEAQLTVFDVAGRRLARMQGRADALRLDGMDASGRRVASGVYFYRLHTESATFFGRLVYLR